MTANNTQETQVSVSNDKIDLKDMANNALVHAREVTKLVVNFQLMIFVPLSYFALPFVIGKMIYKLVGIDPTGPLFFVSLILGIFIISMIGQFNAKHDETSKEKPDKNESR